MSSNNADERSVPMQDKQPVGADAGYRVMHSPKRNRRRDPDCEWVSECPCDWIARVLLYTPVVVALVLVILAHRDLAETNKQLHALNATLSSIDTRVAQLAASLNYRLDLLNGTVEYNGDRIDSVSREVNDLRGTVNPLPFRVDTLNATLLHCCG